MPVRSETFDFISNLDTIWAIVAGAILATTGGLIATQLEHRFDTKRRERESALFFGEIMTMVRMTAEAAERARGIGDPFGPVTMRLLRMVRRELDVYDRNRERLFELKDPIMRAHIHRTLLRTMMGVEGTIESANGSRRDSRTRSSPSPTCPHSALPCSSGAWKTRRSAGTSASTS
jgi:hypothetical protein